jgi:hypothetical protein
MLIRVYKRGLIAMEPSVSELRSHIDKELGAEHIKAIKKAPKIEPEMELVDMQRSIELMAEEAILGKAKAEVWPDIEEKLAQIPITRIPPGTLLLLLLRACGGGGGVCAQYDVETRCTTD